MKNYFKSILGLAVFCSAAYFNHAVAHTTQIDEICAKYCAIDPAPEPEPEPTHKPHPSGNYVSASSSTATKEAVDPALVNLDFVDGTLVRVLWSLVNTGDGVYDWTIIDRELAAAKASNSFIALAIPDSKSMPQFVLDSCKTFDYEFRKDTVQTCLPWDTDYLSAKDKFVSALGDRYDDDENVSGVYFSYAAMGNGLEMHWRVDENDFTDAGYDPELLNLAYQSVFDSYADAFKKTSIIMEVHEVFNSPALAINAYDYCYGRIGERCGVAAWWCASRMVTDSNSSEFGVSPVVLLAAEKSFAVCQTIGNFTDQPDRFGSGTSEQMAESEMQFWKSKGNVSFELWPKDIKNGNLTAYF